MDDVQCEAKVQSREPGAGTGIGPSHSRQNLLAEISALEVILQAANPISARFQCLLKASSRPMNSF